MRLSAYMMHDASVVMHPTVIKHDTYILNAASCMGHHERDNGPNASCSMWHVVSFEGFQPPEPSRFGAFATKILLPSSLHFHIMHKCDPNTSIFMRCGLHLLALSHPQGSPASRPPVSPAPSSRFLHPRKPRSPSFN